MNQRRQYPSDISPEQFAKIQPLLESARKKTRPREVDLYEVFCAGAVGASREYFSVLLMGARVNLKLTQKEAAAKISPLLSVRTLQEWEQGKVSPPNWARQLIVRALLGNSRPVKKKLKRKAHENRNP
jgi:DNA-binding XRE family transcriptional regulator